MNRLDNKVAIITGGAKSQGACEAELFVAAGAKVIITDIDADAGQETASRLGENCGFLSHDVADEDDWASVVSETVKQHGRIDVLVNNAGIFQVVGLQDSSKELWDRHIAINQTGVFLGMREVVPVMKQNKSGSIVNISSIAGLTSSKAHAYCATKWALRGMTKSAAIELGPDGIRVNSVHPGTIDTPMLDAFGDERKELAARVPLGGLGTAMDVARTVLFLASDDASYCSGHEYVVDGALRS
jgi:3alpha(or 20beta)-hydroxysteroid dehydrogenase